MRYRSLLLGTLLLTTGCSTLPEKRRAGDPSRSAASPVPEGVFLIQNVPYFSDADNQCGPASLASVMSFWGVETTPDDLRSELYVPRLKGTLPMDMGPAARDRGLEARSYNGDLDSLRASILAENPLVVFLNVGTRLFPKGHYAVVTGFDSGKSGVFLHSGKHKNMFMPYRKFLKRWEKTKKWTLLVSPKNK